MPTVSSILQHLKNQPRTQGCLSTALAQGIKCLILIGRSKRYIPRSKMIESRQINIANTKFRAFRQSNKRRIIILQGNCFPRTTDASQQVHSSKMAQVKPESKEILSSYNCVNRKIFWRRTGCCFDILVYDTNGAAWKASASGTLFSPWID